MTEISTVTIFGSTAVWAHFGIGLKALGPVCRPFHNTTKAKKTEEKNQMHFHMPAKLEQVPPHCNQALPQRKHPGKYLFAWPLHQILCMGHLLGPLVLALNCFAALFWPTGSTNKASKQRLNGADAAILSQQINIIINWQASKTFSILKTWSVFIALSETYLRIIR